MKPPRDFKEAKLMKRSNYEARTKDVFKNIKGIRLTGEKVGNGSLLEPVNKRGKADSFKMKYLKSGFMKTK